MGVERLVVMRGGCRGEAGEEEAVECEVDGCD